MPIAIYVVFVENHWKVETGGLNLGPFARQSEAVEVGLDLAKTSGKNGYECRVFVQTVESGRWDIVWPSASDACYRPDVRPMKNA
jgi:hypothetical protein